MDPSCEVPEGGESPLWRMGERERDLELQYWWGNRIASTDGQNGRLSHAATGEITFTAEDVDEPEFIRGDCNGDGARTSVTDPVFHLSFNFLGGVRLRRRWGDQRRHGCRVSSLP